MNDQEAFLLAQLRQGNSRAVLSWYRQYQPRLQSFIAQKVSVAADVEELVQETFISCLHSLPGFAGGSSLWTWMCAIAKHEVADYYRRRYAKKVLHLLPLGDWLLGEIGDHEQVAATAKAQVSELAEKLEQVWQRIGADQQELLQQKYLDRCSVAHLAKLRGKTVKAIESELFRARRAFKQAYQEIDD